MSTIDFYFTPLSAAVLEENCLQDPFTLAQNVEIYLEGSAFPEAENAEIAIIGVQEGRGNEWHRMQSESNCIRSVPLPACEKWLTLETFGPAKPMPTRFLR